MLSVNKIIVLKASKVSGLLRIVICAFCFVFYALASQGRAQNADFARSLFYGQHELNVEATLPSAQLKTSAKRFPCSNCHGLGAEGGAEGSARAPSLLPTRLKSKHPKLTAEKFWRALTKGEGLDGKPLQSTMPHYNVTHSQAQLLLDYLQNLEQQETSGLKQQYKIGYVSHRKGEDKADYALAALNKTVSDAKLQNGFWGKTFSFVNLATSPASENQKLLAVIGDGFNISIDADDKKSGPIQFQLLTSRNATTQSRSVSQYHSIEDQFKKILEDIAGQNYANCFVLYSPRATQNPISKAWQDAEKEQKSNCKNTTTGPNHRENSAVVLLIPDKKTIDHLREHFDPSRTKVYGLFDLLLPFSNNLVTAGFSVVLFDPHPTLTDQAMQQQTSPTIAHIQKSFQQLAEALKISGRHATEQEILNVLQNTSASNEPMRKIFLNPN